MILLADEIIDWLIDWFSYSLGIVSVRDPLSACRPVDQNVSPSRPTFVAQLAVARLVCHPDDRSPSDQQTVVPWWVKIDRREWQW